MNLTVNVFSLPLVLCFTKKHRLNAVFETFASIDLQFVLQIKQSDATHLNMSLIKVAVFDITHLNMWLNAVFETFVSIDLQFVLQIKQSHATHLNMWLIKVAVFDIAHLNTRLINVIFFDAAHLNMWFINVSVWCCTFEYMTYKCHVLWCCTIEYMTYKCQCGMSHGMVYTKEPLLLIRKSIPCSGSSGFPLLLTEWPYTICPMPYNRK